MIVGELINSSRKAVRPLMEARDAEKIVALAKAQAEVGAAYIDVNCGAFVGTEKEVMEWAVNSIQAELSVPLCLDSPDPEVLAAGLALAKCGQPMINSLSAEEGRFAAVLPLVQKYQAKVIALCMDDTGLPETAADRLRVADWLIEHLTGAGVPLADIYLDPLVKPVGTADAAGRELLDGIRLIKEKYPQANLICGLSNISYGLPARKVLNRVFMVQTMAMGMEHHILDPLDKTMMGFVYAGQALLGRDPYCGKYLKAYRKGIYE